MSEALSDFSSEFNPGSGVSERGARSSWGGLFFALTGVLIATSLVNIGSSGIAFFYLAFLLPVFALAQPDRWVGRPIDPNFSALLVLLSACAAALFLTTWLQIVLYNRDPATDLMHLWARISFLLYFAVLLAFLKGEVLLKAMIWTRRLLLVVFVYGIYQLPAKLLGLPLFLDWLRNNKSFGMYLYDQAGWVAVVRSTSIFAEPSQSTVPILILFLLNLDRRVAPRHRGLAWMILLLFTVTTFSRTAWLCLFVGWLCVAGCKIPGLQSWFARRRKTVLAVVLLLLVVMPVWGSLYESESTDLSALERTQSIALGIRMIRDAPLLGYGWNSFHDASGNYFAFPLNAAIHFEFIHNMMVSYSQQAGLAGLFLSALPFIVIVLWSTAPPWVTVATAASFLVAAEFGGDIEYSSIFWLWIAILVNWSSMAPYLRSRAYVSPLAGDPQTAQ